MIEFRLLLKKSSTYLPEGIRYYKDGQKYLSKSAILQFRDSSTGRFFDQEDGWEDVPIVDEEDLKKFKQMEKRDEN